MKIFKYIVSLMLLMASLNSSAQYFEKREKDWKPSEFYLSLDAVGLARLIVEDVNFEVQGKVDFDRFYLVLDWGLENIELSGDGFDYSAKGNFFRLGPQVNLMPYNELRSNLYLGLMYGQANFSDDIVYSRSVDYFEDKDLFFNNENIVARWAEINMGINAHVYKNLYLGFLVRFKFASTISGADILTPYEILGYGRADKLNRFGFNYYLTYRIPFRDKPIPTKPRYIPAPQENEEKPGSNSQDKGDRQ